MIKYKRIREDIKQKLLRKEYDDFKLPTEKYLCELYNASRVTVRNALKELENENLIYKIKGKGTFASDNDSVMHSKNIKNIGLISFSDADVVEPFLSNILKGVFNANKKLKYNLKIFSYVKMQESGFNELEKENLNAVIFLSPLPSNAIDWFRDKSIPVVTAYFYYDNVAISAVFPDSVRAGYLLTEYLINKGFKKTGLLLGPITGKYNDVRQSSLIKQGYENALSRLNLPVNEVIIKAGDWNRKTLELELNMLLDNGIDSLICASEGVLRAIIEISAKNKIDTRQKVKVVGFSAEGSIYPFTTVEIPLIKTGEAALGLVYSILNNSAPIQKSSIEPILRVAEESFSYNNMDLTVMQIR